MNASAFTCPHCGSADVRRARRHETLELPRMLLGFYPFRCLGCGGRFSGNIWKLATRGHAACPKCLRLDVVPSVKPEDRVSSWDKLRMALGARMYRCVPCRYYFLSSRRSPHEPD